MPDPFQFAKMFRSTCPLCASRRLAWTHARGAARLLGERQADELLADLPRRDRLEAQVWKCRDCGHHGCFGAFTWDVA